MRDGLDGLFGVLDSSDFISAVPETAQRLPKLVVEIFSRYHNSVAQLVLRSAPDDEGRACVRQVEQTGEEILGYVDELTSMAGKVPRMLEKAERSDTAAKVVKLETELSNKNKEFDVLLEEVRRLRESPKDCDSCQRRLAEKAVESPRSPGLLPGMRSLDEEILDCGGTFSAPVSPSDASPMLLDRQLSRVTGSVQASPSGSGGRASSEAASPRQLDLDAEAASDDEEENEDEATPVELVGGSDSSTASYGDETALVVYNPTGTALDNNGDEVTVIRHFSELGTPPNERENAAAYAAGTREPLTESSGQPLSLIPASFLYPPKAVEDVVSYLSWERALRIMTIVLFVINLQAHVAMEREREVWRKANGISRLLFLSQLHGHTTQETWWIGLAVDFSFAWGLADVWELARHVGQTLWNVWEYLWETGWEKVGEGWEKLGDGWEKVGEEWEVVWEYHVKTSWRSIWYSIWEFGDRNEIWNT